MNTEMKRILLVEDNPGDVRLLIEMLHENGKNSFSVDHVSRIDHALGMLVNTEFDLLLLDLSLPDGSGLGTVQRIAGAAPHLPIIILTGLEDDRLAIESVQAGAQDYLVKGQANGAMLIRTMNHGIERKKMEERIHFLAHHDSLTHLPNRELFQDRLTTSISRSKRNHQRASDQWKIAVMMVDLDHFKMVNDTLGHLQGDLLLKAVANRLQNAIRQSDTVARMGGDEFMLIFENVTGQEDAEVLGKKIQDIFAPSFLINDLEYHITASIGIGLYPEDGEDFETLIRAADVAMYRAKLERNRFCLFGGS